MRRLPLALLTACSLWPPAAQAQAVSCQGVYTDRTVTVQFARQARAVTQALLGRLEPEVTAVEARIEDGLLAEVEGQPRPTLFREALRGLADVATAAESLDQALQALQGTHGQDRTLALFDDALAKILRDRTAGCAASRHAHAAGATPSPAPEPATLGDLLRQQRDALKAMRDAWGRLAEALRVALPLAERGQLAGAGFGARVALFSCLQEAIERWEDLRRLYLEGCRATLAAVNQSYPTGLEWLEEPARGRPLAP